MGIFAGIEEVKAKVQNRWVEPGNYTVEIAKVKQGRKKETDRPFFLAELSIVESDNPDFVDGDIMTWMTMLKEYKKYFLQDISNFISTTMACDPSEVTEEVVEYVAGEEQPLVGKRLTLRAYRQVNPKSGKEFTEHDFRLIN